MTKPQFELEPIGGECFTINDRGRTVAIITSQGYVDWLLKSPMQAGPLVSSIRKETHLSYTLGLKLELRTPAPATRLEHLSHSVEDGGARLVLNGQSEADDGLFSTHTRALLSTDPRHTRYEWAMETRITCNAEKPVELGWIEFNNIYPARAGLGMLHAPVKEYRYTLMVDRDGVVWQFPHQHLMHYSRKISRLHFAPGTLAGFFGEKTGSPVVIVHESPIEPDWAICDMYYDLHCGARPTGPIQPGQSLTFRYTIKYLGRAESEKLLEAARPIPVDAEDRAAHDYPRLELGMNDFSRSVQLDRPDEASGFRTAPPKKVWDKTTGHSTRGSLRITNDVSEETIWTAEPPTNIPPETRLRIRAMMKAERVAGKGAFIRVRYHTYHWHPTPHIEWARTLESPPVAGTTSGWVEVEVPELRVPKQEFDYLVAIDFVLDGKGVAWLTDVDIDLQPLLQDEPRLEEQETQHRSRTRARGRAASGSAASPAS